MEFSAVGVLVAVLLIVLLIAFMVYAMKQKQAKRLEQVKVIHYLLDRVAEAATKRKTQLYESLDSSDNKSLVALHAAAKACPVDITAELEAIDALWTALSQQLAEFSNQSVQSTLQSSVVTTKAAQTANKIAKLVQSTKAKLN